MPEQIQKGTQQFYITTRNACQLPKLIALQTMHRGLSPPPNMSRFVPKFQECCRSHDRKVTFLLFKGT